MEAETAVEIPRHPAGTCMRAGSPFARGINKWHGTVSARVITGRVSRINPFAALRGDV